jgi:hypothetical protein
MFKLRAVDNNMPLNVTKRNNKNFIVTKIVTIIIMNLNILY